VDPKIRVNTRPESKVQKAIIEYMILRGWYVKVIHSSTFMPGMPDLYVCHKQYGERWIEVKDPERTGDLFTPAQKDNFPLMSAHGCKIYVLVGATKDEYDKLFTTPNWWTYIKY